MFVGRDQRFEHLDAAGGFGREELRELAAELVRLLHFRGSADSRRECKITLDRGTHHRGIESGGDRKFRSGVKCALEIVDVEDGSSSEIEVREAFRRLLDDRLGRLSAERDLRRGQSAFDPNFTHFQPGFHIVEHQHRHNPDAGKLIHHLFRFQRKTHDSLLLSE